VRDANDRLVMNELLDMIAQVTQLNDAKNQYAINDDEGDNLESASESDDKDQEDEMQHESQLVKKTAEQVAPRQKLKIMHRLQNEVCTRWNSSLQMIESMLHMRNEVTSALKSIGKYDQ